MVGGEARPKRAQTLRPRDGGEGVPRAAVTRFLAGFLLFNKRCDEGGELDACDCRGVHEVHKKKIGTPLFFSVPDREKTSMILKKKWFPQSVRKSHHSVFFVLFLIPTTGRSAGDLLLFRWALGVHLNHCI